MTETTHFPLWGIEIKLNNDKYWCDRIFTDYKFTLSILKHMRNRTARLRRINNQAELDKAEFEVEKLEDWASDGDYYG